MKISIPVGPITAALVGWLIYEYHDWVGPVALVIIYFGYSISSRVASSMTNAVQQLARRLEELGVSETEIDEIANRRT
ncbi:MAG TPA: hypothetical protein VJ728_00720 [Candidatus Binataceae bacterium]|nr:hypothetical protein [Candidatus Binataceae bacterium]